MQYREKLSNIEVFHNFNKIQIAQMDYFLHYNYVGKDNAFYRKVGYENEENEMDAGRSCTYLGVKWMWRYGRNTDCRRLYNSSTSAGTGSSATEQSGASQTDVGQVTLRFAWWGGDSRHTATLEAIAAYEKQNPNVKIEAEYQGYDGYNDKILTQLAGGTQPDIMQTIATAAAEYQASFPDSFVNLE